MSDRAGVLLLLIGLTSGILLFAGFLQLSGAVDIIHPLGAKLMYAQYPPETPEPINVSKIFPELIKNPDFCLSCHDREMTKEFHIPRKIMKIDERKGKRRRICVDCHGPRGNSATEQMSDYNLIYPQEDGSFRLHNSIPHSIHRKKMEIGAINCDTCHVIREGEVTVPLPDVIKGQILVCERCHLPDENGNYIAIHVEKGSKFCTTCHVGDLVAIHREATFKLGA